MSRLVTVFGASGFIGRYVVQALMAEGWRVRVAERNPKRAWFLKPLGNLGQTQFVAADVTLAESVGRAVIGSDAVVNLVGSMGSDMQAVNGDGARNVAYAAKGAGARALVHISAIGASADSPSRYYRSKGEGEQAVCAAFPDAIILRPSVVFGREDQFTNRFARLLRLAPLMPLVRPHARLQPVFVGDVASAVMAALRNSAAYAGKSFELGGPAVMTLADIIALVAREAGRDRMMLPVPDGIAKPLVRLTGWLPGAPMTWDQWLMLQTDNRVEANAQGLSALGVTPVAMEALAPSWLVQYRRLGRFGTQAKRTA